jgi:hypothetical protein
MLIDIRPSMKGSSGRAKHSQGVDQPLLRSSGAKDMVDVGFINIWPLCGQVRAVKAQSPSLRTA